jgi:hypothetical protein
MKGWFNMSSKKQWGGHRKNSVGNPDLNGSFVKDYWTDRVKRKLDMVTGWARNGASNEQIALNLGISLTSFDRYRREHEELVNALRLGREDAEICVENAMFKRAIGYKYAETTKQRVRVFDSDGEWTGEYEMVTVKKVTKQVEPSVEAQKYWLEHRAPKRWERNPTPLIDTEGVNEAIKSLADLLKNPVQERKIDTEMDNSSSNELK